MISNIINTCTNVRVFSESESTLIMANDVLRNAQKKKATICDCLICFEEFRNQSVLPCSTQMERHLSNLWLKLRQKKINNNSDFVRKFESQLPFNDHFFSSMMDSNWKMKVIKICDHCARVGDNVKAMIWCEQCNELLCSACLKSFNSRLKDSRTHKFLSISESQKLQKIRL